MNIVITGSTKGIGLGMAREFLKRGHDVVISSRRADAVDTTVTELRAEFPDRSVLRCCRVRGCRGLVGMCGPGVGAG